MVDHKITCYLSKLMWGGVVDVGASNDDGVQFPYCEFLLLIQAITDGLFKVGLLFILCAGRV